MSSHCDECPYADNKPCNPRLTECSGPKPAVTQADLKEMAELLAAAERKATQIKNATDVRQQLNYEATVWSQYLLSFESEASCQALYWKADAE